MRVLPCPIERFRRKRTVGIETHRLRVELVLELSREDPCRKRALSFEQIGRLVT